MFILNNCHSFSISALVKKGIFKRYDSFSGDLYWGKQSIHISKEKGEHFIRLSYTLNNQVFRNYTIQYIERKTNLGGTMYLFLCPCTLKPCRKLYLYNGWFVSRHAIPKAMYDYQAESKFERAITMTHHFETPPINKYGKVQYNGKTTPYGKRLQRYHDRYNYYELTMYYQFLERLH